MDAKAVKILFATYWGTGGWKDDRLRSTTPADLEYAKNKGVMFDPVVLTHDDVVRRCISLRDRIDSQAVANAFVWSLRSRELDHRSAIGSYALLRHFPRHKMADSAKRCSVCGQYRPRRDETEDLNILSFERLKWGGVRHLDTIYAAFDLEQFARLPQVVPSKEDVAVFADLLESIRNAPPGTTSSTLQNHFPKCIKSNKAERDQLIGILGMCGVLETASHRGFRKAFVPSDERELPNRRFIDMAYPACWWTQEDGVNEDAVSDWFGHLLK